MALTGKKLKFADAVLAGKSNKQAAIDAGYSPATASAAGSRLVKDKDVVAYLKRRKDAAKKPVPESSRSADKSDGFDLNAALLHKDPKAFLLAAMNDTELEPKLRIDAAKALMPFVHTKRGEGGKKEQAAENAKNAASGRFAPKVPPKLVVSNKR
jgi:phage terminase small subunit